MNSLLFKKSQFKHLASILKCGAQDLVWVLNNIERCYYEYEEYKRDKSGLVKTFKDGTPKKRVISPSYGKLKKLQSSVKRNILDHFKMPYHVRGATKGRSNISNAKLHQGKKFKFTTDLKDFFPGVSNGLVFHAFLKLGYSNHQASLLVKLTTYKFGLPQGAPTSPQLSNLCFLEIDDKILEICEAHRLMYTRYIDDLTFSSTQDFKKLVIPLLDVIKDSGFKINHRKTFYRTNQTITGIDVFNNFIDVPANIKEKAKNEVALKQDSTPFSTYQKRVRQTNTNIVAGVK